MPMNVQYSLPKFDGLELLTREDWRAIGEEAKLRIIRRTRSGLDVDGKGFVGYSDGYERVKRAYGAATDPVNLTVSGAMLDTLSVIDAWDKGVTLGWTQ